MHIVSGRSFVQESGLMVSKVPLNRQLIRRAKIVPAECAEALPVSSTALSDVTQKYRPLPRAFEIHWFH